VTVAVAVGRGVMVTVGETGVIVAANSEPQAESRVKVIRKNISSTGNLADIAKTPGV